MNTDSLALLIKRLKGNEDILSKVIILDGQTLKDFTDLKVKAFYEACKIIRASSADVDLSKKIKLLKLLDVKNYLDSKNDYSTWDLEMLMALNEATSYNHALVELILRNDDLRKANLTYEAIQVIKKSKKYYNAKYATMVITDSDAIKAGIALEGAEIINESKSALNAQYASHILRDPFFIKLGIALECARIINESKDLGNIEYLNDVLRDSNCIKAEIAIEGAKIINESKNALNAQYASYILRDVGCIEAKIALKGAKLAINSKCPEQCYHMISNQNAIKAGIALKGAEVISELEEEFQAIVAYNFMNSEFFNGNSITLECARMIGKAENREIADLFVLYLCENINDPNILKMAEEKIIELNCCKDLPEEPDDTVDSAWVKSRRKRL